VTVTFSHNGHTETTAADGTYSYAVSYGTTTTVTPSPDSVKGWNPGHRDVLTVVSNVANQDSTVLADGDDANQENGPTGTNPSYDGNDDGMADHVQDNVCSLPSCDGQSYLTLSCPDACWLENVGAVDNPSPDNAPMVRFPCQFFEFEIKGLANGGATTLTIYLPAGVSYDTYWKYGPTPDDHQSHWYEFIFDGKTGAEISGSVITLHFMDSKRGDDDLTANGSIVDQGGPGAKIISIPALGTWGVFILFAFMTGAGFYALRRRFQVEKL
jgi:hypothetical protein